MHVGASIARPRRLMQRARAGELAASPPDAPLQRVCAGMRSRYIDKKCVSGATCRKRFEVPTSRTFCTARRGIGLRRTAGYSATCRMLPLGAAPVDFAVAGYVVTPHIVRGHNPITPMSFAGNIAKLIGVMGLLLQICHESWRRRCSVR